MSSAEWILETPSVCNGNNFCQVLPLANFGRATITAANATTTRGIKGTISNRAWNTSKITLASSGRTFINGGQDATVSTASPSSLSPGGGTFSITYTSTQVTGPTTGPVTQGSLRTGKLVRPGRTARLVRPARASR